MGCNSCGKSKCGCGVTTLCGSCNSTPCQCQSVIPACQTPFYAQSDVCIEDHCQKIFKATYAAALKVDNAFVIPACNQSAEFKISGLFAIALGSYLWNPAVGYLRVTAFDAFRQIVTVTNECQAGNAAVGTTFPACTQFIVTDPPAITPGGSQTGCFVDVPGFTAPAVGDCLLILVTCVTGLAVNKNVGIGSGTYRVNAIPDSTHIEICNDGLGITPGTPVVAKVGDVYQYPLVAIDVNPCTNELVDEGTLLVCKDGVQQPVTGALAGMVWHLEDPVTGKGSYIFLDVPTRTCATITCCFTIVDGLAGPYVVPVSSTASFNIGDILQIGTRTDRFTVTDIPDATTLVGTLSPVPTATEDVAPSTSICLIDCCEDLQNQVNDIINDIAAIPCDPLEMWLFNEQQEVLNTTSTPLVDTGNPAVSPVDTWITISAQNQSTCRNAVLTFYIETSVQGNLVPAGGDLSVQFTLGLNIDGAGLAPYRTINRTLVDTGNGVNDIELVNVVTFTLAPGQSKSIQIVTGLMAPAGAGQYQVTSWLNRMAAVGLT